MNTTSTKHQISILGSIRLDNLEALRITLGITKLVPAKAGNSSNQQTGATLRQNIDLYNDTSIEKLTRKVAERLEIATAILGRDLDSLTNELEKYRLREVEQQGKLYEKLLSIFTRAYC
jgi:hypothetical protein